MSLHIYHNNNNNTHTDKNKHLRMKNTPTTQCAPVISPKILFITTLFMIIITTLQPTHQSNLCPKPCSCDDQTLETICRGTFVATGIPHTLNPSMKSLIMNQAQLLSLSGVDSYLSLESLDLAHNKIPAIDFDQIKSNTNLISMNASHNNIVELKDSSVIAVINKLEPSQSKPSSGQGNDDPEQLRGLLKARINIVELVLSYNHLTILRNYTFVRWSKLLSLDLSYNSISILEPHSLFGQTKLEHINLRGNRLKQVPGLALHSTTKSFSYIGSSNEQSQLKTLDLSENSLNSLESYSFYALGQLQELYLDTCSLQSIDVYAFQDVKSLHLLSMNQNTLTDIPTESFSPLTSLKILKMDLNDIKYLRPNSFKNLYNLEELQIDNGSLQEIQPQAFSGLISLKKLQITYNTNLTTVYSDMLYDMPRLTHLNLSANSLASLQSEDSLKNHLLLTLDLRQNPLKCDCKLKWLTGWLKRVNETVNAPQRGIVSHFIDAIISPTHNKNQLINLTLIRDLLNITCTGPPALAGKRVIDLPDNKLECIRPTSSLNVNLGFASLFFMTLILTTICMVNFCRNEKHLIGILKENLVQNRISMMLPYTQDLHKNVDNFKKETQFECAEYEPVDYAQNYGQIYTLPNDQYSLHDTQQQQTNHL